MTARSSGRLFGALAAEPLYLLVDTAIVGPLGTQPLAIGVTVLTARYTLFNFPDLMRRLLAAPADTRRPSVAAMRQPNPA